MTIAAPTATQIVEAVVPSRRESFRFDLLDRANAVIGTLDVDRTHAPQVVNNVNRAIRRTLDDLRIPPATLAAIDTISDRVQPVMVLGGVDYPLGVFLFADASRTPHTWGTEAVGKLVDQCMIVDQPLDRTVGYDVGQTITDALVEQANAAGVTDTSGIVTATSTLQAPVGWPAGRTSRLEVMGALCSSAGYLAPYFDNDGLLRCRPAPAPSSVDDATYSYAPGADSRVFVDTPLESDDLLSAPNRYVALDSSATETPVVGRYDIPDEAPHSILNRGFAIVSTVEIQGLADTAAADEAARARAQQDSSTFRWLSFDAAADPRHDTFDLVAYDGVLYREQSWQLRLDVGAAHHHDLRRQYFDA